MIYSIVTGGGSGIGRSLAHELARRDRHVLIVGRHRDSLEETQKCYPDKIDICVSDIALPAERENITAFFSPQDRIEFLVHNAGVLEPVGPLSEIELDAWRYHQAVNVEAPLFLTQALLPRLSGGRILHVSSGAAHRPISGWGAYCTSKAALHMLYRCLRNELKESDIHVGSARPGVVDTPMQEHIRSTSRDRFPEVERYRALKEKNQLYPPEEVGRFLAWLLIETPAEVFSNDEWDIRETDKFPTSTWKKQT